MFSIASPVQSRGLNAISRETLALLFLLVCCSGSSGGGGGGSSGDSREGKFMEHGGEGGG